MSTHEFMITVEVTEHQTSVHTNDWEDRTPADYAAAALFTAGYLTDARQLDGFADLSATAYISEITKIS